MKVFINKNTGVLVYSAIPILSGGPYKTVGSDKVHMPRAIEDSEEWQEIFIKFDIENLKVYSFLKEGYLYTYNLRTNEYSHPFSNFKMEERHATIPRSVIKHYFLNVSEKQFIPVEYLKTLTVENKVNETVPIFSIRDLQCCIAQGRDKIIENLTNLIKKVL